MWPIRRGRAAGQVIVFGPFVLNRFYNFMRVCPEQGMVARLSSSRIWLIPVFRNPRWETFAQLLKELCHGVFIHFSDLTKLYFLINGNLKIIVS